MAILRGGVGVNAMIQTCPPLWGSIGDQQTRFQFQSAGGNDSISNRCACCINSGWRDEPQDVGGGHGHYGAQHDLGLHFGLGTRCEAAGSIQWPDRDLTTQTVTLYLDFAIGPTGSGSADFRLTL